jgi:N(2)-fixation sustaining protein CowN
MPVIQQKGLKVTCSVPSPDRYLSFEGIACDDHARRIVDSIRACLADIKPESPWHNYFATKLAENAQRGHDDLYFVGSQINAIRELFATYDRPDALELLEQVEEECC